MRCLVELPFIDAGNHTMELTIEDLEVGANYTVEMTTTSLHHGDSGGLHLHRHGRDDVRDLLPGDRQPNLHGHRHQPIRGDGRGTHLCGTRLLPLQRRLRAAPSPFTLTYDGVEWEEQWNYQYDECEDMGDGYECWNDDWDNDGDGEPDWTNFYEECDELSDGAWECVCLVEQPVHRCRQPHDDSHGRGPDKRVELLIVG